MKIIFRNFGHVVPAYPLGAQGDCRNPEAKDGEGLSHPCELDTGIPASMTEFLVFLKQLANQGFLYMSMNSIG